MNEADTYFTDLLTRPAFAKGRAMLVLSWFSSVELEMLVEKGGSYMKAENENLEIFGDVIR